MKINYLLGDASKPEVPGPTIITHVVNDQGAWGAGFTRSLTQNWSEAENEYRLWHRYRASLAGTSQSFNLGHTRHSLVRGNARPNGRPQSPVWVSHMLAQEGLTGSGNPRPLRYDALGACLLEVGKMAKLTNASVHMPRIGCGLAGGNWVIVEQLVHDALVRELINVYVYDLES